MTPSELTFDPKTGTFLDAHGKHWIRNIFVEESPIYICMDEPVWNMPAHSSQYPSYLDWNSINLPAEIISAIKISLVGIISKTSGAYLTKHRIMLTKLSTAYSTNAISGEFLSSVRDLSILWNDWLATDDRSILRNLYKNLEANGVVGTSKSTYNQLRSWKAKHNTQPLRNVLEWDPEKGALTSSELEVLLKELANPRGKQGLIPSSEFARIVIWIFVSTFRRTSQVLQIPSDGLKRVPSSNGNELAYLVTPRVKAQINSDPTWEPIPTGLADDIESYRSRPEMMALADTDQLLLFAVTRTGERSGTTAAGINTFIKTWVKNRNIVSPRTGKLMHLTMNRLRHTGGTQLAIQGYPRDIIQGVLQHDSHESAQSYIDSVGADTTPVFERMDRKLGGRFSDMKNAFFKGRIVPEATTDNPPVLLPNSTVPSVVGACGKQSHCSLHPLLSCYSCMHFLAFPNADHEKVLEYLNDESKAWHSVEYGASRGKSLKDFQRIAAGVQEVIDLISVESSKNNRKEDVG